MECGYYWARYKEFKWFNLIVEIYGQAPFQQMRGWDVSKDRFGKLDSDEVIIGPKIEKHEVEKAP